MIFFNTGVITLLYLNTHSYFIYNTGYLYRKYNYSITYTTNNTIHTLLAEHYLKLLTLNIDFEGRGVLLN